MDSLNNNEMFQKLQFALEHHSSFVKELGIKLNALDKDSCETEMEILPQFFNLQQTVHGGVLYSMADTTAGIAAISATGSLCVTLNSSISFLAPVGEIGTKLTGRAKALRWGRRTAVCEVYLYDRNETLCVRGTFTFCPKRQDGDRETAPKPLMPE
jgi:acyl-CoA thioesterase